MSYEITVQITDPTELPTPVANNVSDETINSITISYGRQNTSQTFSPSACSISLVRDSSLGTIAPEWLKIGNLLVVYVELDPANPPNVRTRFAGRITDVSIDKDIARITATSQVLSRLGRLQLENAVVGTYTPENALYALLAETSFSFDPSVATSPQFSPGRYELSVNAPAGSNALQAWQTVTNSEPLGCLFETISGSELVFTDVNDRKAGTPDFTLTGDEILDSWQATKNSTQYANRAKITYSSGSVALEDASSVTENGATEVGITTYIASSVDATSYAQVVLYRQLFPKYITDGITIPVSTLPLARQKDLLVNSIGQGITIGSLIETPSIDPDLTTLYFVEGWTEQISRSRWLWRLYLSDYRTTKAPQAWDDVPASTTWGDVGVDQPTLTWLLASAEDVL